MKNSFAKNPALFIGLALPLVMILIFAGVPFLRSFMIPGPQYNFIYSINNYEPNGKLKVEDGKLILQVYNSWNEPREPQQTIYLVDVHSKKSIKLNFLPSKEEITLIPSHERREFILEGVTLKALDTSNISPDGYQVMSNDNDNIFSLIFFFGNNKRNYISLSNSGRIDNFPIPTRGYGGKFEGWVIPKDEKQ